MICREKVHEEEIIDYIQGNNKENGRMRTHLEQCTSCRSAYDSWNEIFRSAPFQSPPERVMKKIRKNVSMDRNRRRFKPIYMMVSLNVAVIVLFVGYILVPFLHREPAQQFVVDPTSSQPFLIKDDTQVYEILSELGNNIKGYAWINQNSNEMMLLVDGLHTVPSNDYQAWIKTNNELTNAGLMKVSNQTGQLYYQDRNVNHLEHIIVSKEPLGGSHQPSDPNPFLLKLQNK